MIDRKKTVVILLIFVIFIGCTNNSSGEDKSQQETEISEKLAKVEITITKEFLQDENYKEMILVAKDDGVKEITKNKDHSITITMSEEQHKVILNDLEIEMKNTIEEIEDNDDFPSIQKIIPNESFTEYILEVDRELYEDNFDGFSVMGLGMSGLFYQLFNGKKIKNSVIIIYVKDGSTGEIFDKIPYPEMLEHRK